MIRKISYKYSKGDVENIERICKKIKEIKAGDRIYFPLKTDVAGQIDECIVKSAESKGNVIIIKFSLIRTTLRTILLNTRLHIILDISTGSWK